MARYHPPQPQQPIVVNVDNWLAERQTSSGLKYPTPPAPYTPPSLSPSEAQDYQQRLADRLVDYDEMVYRHEALVKDEKGEVLTKECAECGHDFAYYENDFLCYQCRDRMDGY